MPIMAGNDYVVLIEQIRDGVSGNYVNDASLTFTALANWTGISGTPVSGATAIPMTLYGSKGTYQGVLPGTVGLTPSMNPLAIEVDGVNYNIKRRIIEEISY